MATCIQVRHASGCTQNFDSIKEAHEEILKNPSILKLSFQWEDSKIERYIPITSIELNNWSAISKARIIELCPSILESNHDDLFWIGQSIISSAYEPGEVSEEMYLASLIFEALTDQEFIERYCI